MAFEKICTHQLYDLTNNMSITAGAELIAVTYVSATTVIVKTAVEAL